MRQVPTARPCAPGAGTMVRQPLAGQRPDRLERQLNLQALNRQREDPFPARPISAAPPALWRRSLMAMTPRGGPGNWPPGRTPVAGYAPTNSAARERCCIAGQPPTQGCGPFSSPSGDGWPTTAPRWHPGLAGRSVASLPVRPRTPKQLVLIAGEPSRFRSGDPRLTGLRLLPVPSGHRHVESPVRGPCAKSRALAYDVRDSPAGARARAPLSSNSPARPDEAAEATSQLLHGSGQRRAGSNRLERQRNGRLALANTGCWSPRAVRPGSDLPDRQSSGGWVTVWSGPTRMRPVAAPRS